jgi:hypothetical protein
MIDKEAVPHIEQIINQLIDCVIYKNGDQYRDDCMHAISKFLIVDWQVCVALMIIWRIVVVTFVVATIKKVMNRLRNQLYIPLVKNNATTINQDDHISAVEV